MIPYSYTTLHEAEVIDMMEELFDEETMRRQLDIARSRRYYEKGLAKGIEKGIEKGETKGKMSVALNLLSLGTMSQEDIAKATDLTLEEIRELSVKVPPAANI